MPVRQRGSPGAALSPEVTPKSRLLLGYVKFPPHPSGLPLTLTTLPPITTSAGLLPAGTQSEHQARRGQPKGTMTLKSQTAAFLEDLSYRSVLF